MGTLLAEKTFINYRGADESETCGSCFKVNFNILLKQLSSASVGK